MSTEQTKEQNKAIVRKAIAALSQGDMEGFLADATDDFTLTVMGSAIPPMQGKQKVLKGLQTGEPAPGGSSCRG